MSDYKQRFIVEYKQLADRCDKLITMLDRYKAGTLDFTPDCPIELLSEQLTAMIDYKAVLDKRARIEHIDIN